MIDELGGFGWPELKDLPRSPKGGRGFSLGNVDYRTRAIVGKIMIYNDNANFVNRKLRFWVAVSPFLGLNDVIHLFTKMV